MNNIVLTGFMGTGKSTVGAVVADLLGWQFLDTDALIVARAGITIPEIFAQHGEAAFRELEREVCAEVTQQHEAVIATGGGALINPDTLALMQQNGLIICLYATPNVIEARLAEEQNRPLATNWRELLEQRRAAYAAIPHQINTSDKSPQQLAQEVIILWQSYK
ncbi:MAG: shikimate kinase [Phototrophicales bacterium]